PSIPSTLPPPPSPLFPYTTLFRSPDASARIPTLPVPQHRTPKTPNKRTIEVPDRLPQKLLNQFLNHVRDHPLRLVLFIRLRPPLDRKSTRLNSSHVAISYAVFCLK